MKSQKKKKRAVHVWTEMFRPETLKDIILPNYQRKIFASYIKQGEIPNILLYSNKPGTGKTSLAKLMCRELNADYIYINGSDDRGIQVLRTKITSFASTKSMSGKPKIIILDEFDGSTPDLQQALRGFIEKFTNMCRFIMTCNYETKIIEPLKSRLIDFDMNYSQVEVRKEMEPKMIKRMTQILDFKKVEYKKDVIERLVEINYPDMRSCVKLCQKYSSVNGIIDSNIFNMEQVDEEFFQFILDRNFAKARKYLIESGHNYDEMFRNMYDDFIPKLPKQNQPNAVILIAEYMYKNSFVIDKEINFAALILELIGDLNE